MAQTDNFNNSFSAYATSLTFTVLVAVTVAAIWGEPQKTHFDYDMTLFWWAFGITAALQPPMWRLAFALGIMGALALVGIMLITKCSPGV